ncbi:hypothetical protein GCM10022291_26450 [Postechiella marina]|uniref:LamG-like jellyroll fold domain-containing protein n=1 Tax=Postechiella marina TaxID=943941 RepID=A0ABP8CDN0_9FLAO
MFTPNNNSLFAINKIQILFVFTLLSTQILIGQTISDRSFAIAEFSKKESIISVLKNDFSKKNFGMSIKVIKNSELELQLDQGHLSLKKFFELLKTSINRNENNIFPLFIKYDGNDDKLIGLLKSVSLYNKCFFKNQGERWPEIKTIQTLKKPLIIFSSNSASKTLNKASNHIIKYSAFNTNNKTSIDSLICNEFLSVKHFTEQNIIKNNITKNWNNLNLNAYSINYLLRSWKITGKRPNFIFYSSLKRNGTLFNLTKIINETPFVKGSVQNETHIVKDINWAHKRKTFTNRYFSFPYEKGKTLELKPLKEGYSFTPSSIKISDKTNLNKSFNFKAEKLDLTKNLTAFYKFNNNLKNEVQDENLKENKTKFINDINRGYVLKIDNKNVITLKEVDHYKIVNSSFTIAIDFKYSTTNNQTNYCILGNNQQGFRKGLHVNILAGKPAFGFYTNDCKPNYTVAPEKWYRLVVKYNLKQQIQSIFIDGKHIGNAANRPSFIGSTNLLLGHGIKQKNYFTGYLDNLQIWNRALSDDEIKWIANNTLVLKAKTENENRTIIFFISLALLALLLFLFFKLKKNQKKKDLAKPISKHHNNKNITLYLFGKFSLINAKGVDIANTFSPKIKELFLLVLLRTLNNKKGIKTSELTGLLWEGFLPDKAANNRGVSFNALKKTLKDIDDINVVYKNKLWKIEFSDKVDIDYAYVLNFIKTKNTNYQDFFEKVKRGEFLYEIKKDWLLEEKSTLNFDILDLLMLYCKTLYNAGKTNTVLEITTYIQNIDNINVQALYYQLNSLIKMGSKSKAIYLFDNFCEKYELVNTVKFKYNLKQFLQEDIENIWE